MLFVVVTSHEDRGTPDPTRWTPATPGSRTSTRTATFRGCPVAIRALIIYRLETGRQRGGEP
jgi:hypothetical protein